MEMVGAGPEAGPHETRGPGESSAQSGRGTGSGRAGGHWWAGVAGSHVASGSTRSEGSKVHHHARETGWAAPAPLGRFI